MSAGMEKMRAKRSAISRYSPLDRYSSRARGAVTVGLIWHGYFRIVIAFIDLSVISESAVKNVQIFIFLHKLLFNYSSLMR